MKRLLYITAFPPNKRSGGQTFSLNAINDLQQKFDIDVIYFKYNDHKIGNIGKARVLKVFEPRKENCLSAPAFFPIFTKRYSKKIEQYIQQIADQYDVLYFDFSQVSIYSLYIRHPYKVIRCHDIMAQRYSRHIRFVLPWVRLSESKILKSAKNVFVPSPKDCNILMSEYGIHSEFTHEYLGKFDIPEETAEFHGFILFGLWSRKENLDGLTWLVKNVIPQLNSEIVSSIKIMGGGLSPEYQHQHLDPLHIEYLGFVDNQYAEIYKVKAMIAPVFKGAGVKVKVLDALNTGTPVIGTDVAFEGIDNIPKMMIRSNTAAEFISNINSMASTDITSKKSLQEQFNKMYDNRHLTDFLG